jgi:hypothetical protein
VICDCFRFASLAAKDGFFAEKNGFVGPLRTDNSEQILFEN